MKDYLLDTDILISFLRGKNENLKLQIEELLYKKARLCISIISLGELYHGAFKSANPPKNLSIVSKLIEKLYLINLDKDIIMLYGEILTALEKAGHIIGDFDVLIASSAIVNDLILSSGNMKHYQKIIDFFGQLNFQKWEI